MAGRLVGAALVDTDGWNKLAYLTTRIGNRLSGSQGLERAVAWASEQMKADGLDNVRLQPVRYRSTGASRAAKLGAAASLVRSVSGRSL